MAFTRRKFLQSTALSSIGLTAGCSALDGSGGSPEFELVETLQTDARAISLANPSRGRFTFTVQNAGTDGDITVALFWQLSEGATEPETVDHVSLTGSGFTRERERQLFFEAGERRTIEMNASLPEDAVGYYFIAQASTYGANVRNDGSGGQAELRMDYTANQGIGASETVTAYIGADSTERVLFDVMARPGTNWEIEVV
ncbi:hypothetical protein [Haloarchaeobius salinus]|uniref:hypothetical protein n=1 Tax=Haloarchaeobius salinus TaxID=1198298 RepID=UPI002108894F|nr:hypothetical protein [Haloarchaeobius salinus]